MASPGKITVSTKLTWAKAGAQVLAQATETITQVGEDATEKTQIIAHTSEQIDFGDVTGVAYVSFVNQNTQWAKLTDSEKAAAGGDQDAYELANTVYVGTTNPMTSSAAIYIIIPGAGASLKTDVATDWFAITETTTPVHLLVVAIEP